MSGSSGMTRAGRTSSTPPAPIAFARRAQLAFRSRQEGKSQWARPRLGHLSFIWTAKSLTSGGSAALLLNRLTLGSRDAFWTPGNCPAMRTVRATTPICYGREQISLLHSSVDDVRSFVVSMTANFDKTTATMRAYWELAHPLNTTQPS